MTMTIAPTHAVQLWPMRSSSGVRRWRFGFFVRFFGRRQGAAALLAARHRRRGRRGRLIGLVRLGKLRFHVQTRGRSPQPRGGGSRDRRLHRGRCGGRGGGAVGGRGRRSLRGGAGGGGRALAGGAWGGGELVGGAWAARLLADLELALDAIEPRREALEHLPEFVVCHDTVPPLRDYRLLGAFQATVRSCRYELYELDRIAHRHLARAGRAGPADGEQGSRQGAGGHRADPALHRPARPQGRRPGVGGGSPSTAPERFRAGPTTSTRPRVIATAARARPDEGQPHIDVTA